MKFLQYYDEQDIFPNSDRSENIEIVDLETSDHAFSMSSKNVSCNEMDYNLCLFKGDETNELSETLLEILTYLNLLLNIIYI